jgi:hypothetical protein
MKIIRLIVIIQILFLTNIMAQQDSTDLIIGDWYAKNFGSKDIKINDTILFDTTKIECKDTNCDFLKWTLKSRGDFEYSTSRNREAYDGRQGILSVKGKNRKWGIVKKSLDLVISGDNSIATYRLVRISKSQLIVKKIR